MLWDEVGFGTAIPSRFEAHPTLWALRLFRLGTPMLEQRTILKAPHLQHGPALSLLSIRHNLDKLVHVTGPGCSTPSRIISLHEGILILAHAYEAADAVAIEVTLEPRISLPVHAALDLPLPELAVPRLEVAETRITVAALRDTLEVLEIQRSKT